MFQVFLRFSGILATLVAWLFVVAPAIAYGIDSKNEPITAAVVKNRKVMMIVSFGLIVGAFLQGFFLFYLIQRFGLPLFGIGSFLYLTSNIATILVAIFHFDKHPKIHQTFAEYYFVVSPLSLAFIGFTAIKNGAHLFIFSLIIVLLYFAGSGIVIKKLGSQNAWLEMWAFIMLSVWTIVFTVL